MKSLNSLRLETPKETFRNNLKNNNICYTEPTE